MDHTLAGTAISHSFGKRSILSDVEISCNTGEVLAIFGRNGTGKSTLLKILFGTLLADKAQLYIDGDPVSPTAKMNRFVGYHHQSVFLPNNSLVRSLVPLYFPDGEKQNKIFYEKHINKIENKKVGTLSTGEQRFLQFLFVLYLDHYFMLMDEPFSMVEPLYKDLIKQKIEEHRSQKGFIITDHYYADVLDVATRKVLIADGEIKRVDEDADLVKHGYLSDKNKNRN